MQKKRVFLVVRVAVGLALIVFVIGRIRFRDRLVFPESSGRPPVVGQIVSEEDGRVLFRAEDGSELEVARSELLDGRPQHGLVGIVRQIRWKPFALALLSLAGTYLVTIIRWRWLCVARKIPLGFGDAVRFSFLGFFFNNAVPGATGGDVLKAYFASRNRAAKTDVFASVILDRIIGLTALVFLAGGAILLQAGDLRSGRLARAIYLVLLVTVVGGLVYYSRRLRRVLGLRTVARFLPFPDLVQRIDRAFFLYRLHKRVLVASFLVSFLAHGFTILNHILLGAALGLHAPLSAYFIYVPIGQVASALPIVPGGWGVREFAYGYLFRRAGLTFSQGTALSILHGLCVLLWSLLGGFFFMAGHERLPEEPVDGLLRGREGNPEAIPETVSEGRTPDAS
jgi:uncharacterized protein (TIRG00374 family)